MRRSTIKDCDGDKIFLSRTKNSAIITAYETIYVFNKKDFSQLRKLISALTTMADEIEKEK